MASQHPIKASAGTKSLASANPFETKASSNASSSSQAQAPAGGNGGGGTSSYYASTAPSINAPVAGGGALRSIDDKFEVNASTGTSSLSIPFAVPPGRSACSPSITLGYNSGSGNGAFGLGWSFSLPSISRKTSDGIPRYDDENDSDIFLFTGVEDLVPKLAGDSKGGQRWLQREEGEWVIRQYWPRTEGAFIRIERWSRKGQPSETFWRTISGANVTSFYGRGPDSRISDPSTGRIFAWLICATHDPTGNAIEYQYRSEDATGIRLDQAHEARRTKAARTANRYVKSIRYGNKKPMFLAKDATQKPASTENEDWMFQVVFDYGDHDANNPTTRPDKPWLVRKDPFSTHTSGFELRTYRLCRRLLLFHHFVEELGVQDYLVRSMELTFAESGSVSLLSTATQTSHALDASRKRVSKSLPPLGLEYSTVDLGEAVVETVPASALRNLPAGLSGPVQWVDLDGDGKASPLVTGESEWYQVKNLSSYNADYHDVTASTGNVHFGLATPMLSIPATERNGKLSLLDIDGNGRLDVVRAELGQQGFYERTDEGGWTEFTRFPKWPTIDLKDTSNNLRYLDLTGDGLPDIVIAEADSLVWYPALGTDGYGAAVRAPAAASEEESPRILFSDGMESIYLADFTGDGLSDLVRIRNGDICYWPNLGYGHFGPKVSMDNAPWMGPQSTFDNSRVQLADIDGTGVADIIYFPPAQGGLRVYFNQCGNSWSDPVELHFPLLDSLSQVSVVDLFGLGVSSVVWSTNLPSSGAATLHYFDFTRGRKPHLLTATRNGPTESRMQYTSSVALRETDERNGRPWATRLGFPVQCLTRVVRYDHLSKAYSESSYSYHDGYYDRVEKEFRGFARVDATSKEHFLLGRSALTFPSPAETEGTLSSPITRTVSWYHLGSWESTEMLQTLQKNEYYHSSGFSNSPLSISLRDMKLVLPADATPAETRQAYRALKGSLIHSEVYQVDGTAKEHIPFTISDSTSSVKVLQRATTHHPAVFLVCPRESISCRLERDDTDPRITHTLQLEADDFGQEKKSLSVAYGRRASKRTPAHTEEDWQAQGTTLLTYTERDYTNSVITPDEFHIPLAFESRVYEVKGLTVAPGADIFTVDEVFPQQIKALNYKQYTDGSDLPGLRLMARQQTRFRANDLSRMLGPSSLESKAIAGECYTLAMSPELAALAFRRLDPLSPSNGSAILGGTGESDGGYVDLESNGFWWIPSGQARMVQDPYATPEQELEAAKASFFQPARFIDPFGGSTTVTYDGYHAHVLAVADALGNCSTAAMDYRTLQPSSVVDENGNQSFAVFDVHGLCAGIAIAGKPEAPLGDMLDGFQPDADPEAVLRLLSDPDRFTSAVLRKATSVSFSKPPSRLAEGGWRPGFVLTATRDTHAANLSDGALPQIQASVSFADGRGQSLQTRSLSKSRTGTWVVEVGAIVNSAGAVVREYDSALATSPDFGFPGDVVSGTNFYDAAGRPVCSIFPNRTWTKTIYGTWTQLGYDPGDTLMIEDPTKDVDVGAYFSGLENTSLIKPTWYFTMLNSTDPSDKMLARGCEHYAGKPTEVWLDVVGSTMLSVVDNGSEGKHASRCYTDRQGRVKKVIDAEGRMVGSSTFDMVGSALQNVSMDTGESWLVNNVAGLPIRSGNGRKIQIRTCYDPLRRPIKSITKVGDDGREFISQMLVYGEGRENAQSCNLSGKLYQSRDQAGVVTNVAYDHLGNLLRGTQRLVREYKDTVDWAGPVPMEDETFVWSATFDALGRPLTKTRADASVVTHSYDGSLLSRVMATGAPGASGDIIQDISYNARGQRTRVVFGNGTESRYEYHPTSFWIDRKSLVRGKDVVQDLRYIRDCMGRIIRIEDRAQQNIFFRGDVVKPIQEFDYDVLGRLRRATGREHIGQVGKNWKAVPSASSTGAQQSSPSDGKAMVNYEEKYRYSPEGNILSIAHTTSDPAAPGWTRVFQYTEPSLVEPDKHNNRLSSTSVGNEVATYKYEGLAGTMGLITSMSGFAVLQYDFRNRLCQSSVKPATDGNTPETTWYRYDANNHRVRKTSERFATAGQEASRSKDHLYLDMEIFRRFGGTDNAVKQERWTWHVADDEDRIMFTEANKSLSSDSVSSWSKVVSLYALADHVSSTSLMLDERGAVITQEEYSPYGSTTYDASANLDMDKRYRYAGKERDSETGLYYFENRYLMTWLGRWLSPDPLGTVDGLNPYVAMGGDPVNHTDPSGLMFQRAASRLRLNSALRPFSTPTRPTLKSTTGPIPGITHAIHLGPNSKTSELRRDEGSSSVGLKIIGGKAETDTVANVSAIMHFFLNLAFVSQFAKSETNAGRNQMAAFVANPGGSEILMPPTGVLLTETANMKLFHGVSIWKGLHSEPQIRSAAQAEFKTAENPVFILGMSLLRMCLKNNYGHEERGSTDCGSLLSGTHPQGFALQDNFTAKFFYFEEIDRGGEPSMVHKFWKLEHIEVMARALSGMSDATLAAWASSAEINGQKIDPDRFVWAVRNGLNPKMVEAAAKMWRDELKLTYPDKK